MISHTIPAAGVASVIKTALALHHKVLPPTLNVTTPNPKLEIEQDALLPEHRDAPVDPRRLGAAARRGQRVRLRGHQRPRGARGIRPVRRRRRSATRPRGSSEVCLLEARVGGGARRARPASSRRSSPARSSPTSLRSRSRSSSASLAAELGAPDRSRPRRLAIVADLVRGPAREARGGDRQARGPELQADQDREGDLLRVRARSDARARSRSSSPARARSIRTCSPTCACTSPRPARCSTASTGSMPATARGFVLSDWRVPAPRLHRRGAGGRRGAPDTSSTLAVESVLTANAAVYEVLRRLVPRIDALVGHSTGEHSAAMAAGALDLHVDADLAAFCHGLNDSYAAADDRHGRPAGGAPVGRRRHARTSPRSSRRSAASCSWRWTTARTRSCSSARRTRSRERASWRPAAASSARSSRTTAPCTRRCSSRSRPTCAASSRCCRSAPPSLPLWSCTSAAPHTRRSRRDP